MISDISLDFDICIRKPDRFGYPSCLSELFFGYKNDDSRIVISELYPKLFSDFRLRKRKEESKKGKEGESMTHFKATSMLVTDVGDQMSW